MRRDHLPYFLKRTAKRFEEAYARHFLHPQFESIGPDGIISNPWNLEIIGSDITVGKCVHILTNWNQKVRFVSWATEDAKGAIEIGDYCMISPGVRISSLSRITVGTNAMLASNVYLTDADWHGTYDRTTHGDKMAPVTLMENSWIGDSAIVCKGVTVGVNSIVGAGAVVSSDVPDNCIAAGNPAVVVKELDPSQEIRTRGAFFADPVALNREIDDLDRYMRRDNSLLKWLRAKAFPSQRD